MPVGPTSVNSFSRWSSDIVESKPGKPLKWSPCRCEMKTPASFCGEIPARAIWVCVPSPQSNSHHSPSPTTASALTLRRSVGLPELVPSGMIFILPFSIFHMRFSICHLKSASVDDKWKISYGKWEMPSLHNFVSCRRSVRHSALSPSQHTFARIVPAVQDYFVVSVKVKALVSLNVQIAEERLVPSREGKDGHRRGNADVDADHAAIDVARERARRAAVASEYDRAVAVSRLVGARDRLAQIIDPHHRQDRPEDFVAR